MLEFGIVSHNVYQQMEFASHYGVVDKQIKIVSQALYGPFWL